MKGSKLTCSYIWASRKVTATRINPTAINLRLTDCDIINSPSFSLTHFIQDTVTVHIWLQFMFYNQKTGYLMWAMIFNWDYPLKRLYTTWYMWTIFFCCLIVRLQFSVSCSAPVCLSVKKNQATDIFWNLVGT